MINYVCSYWLSPDAGRAREAELIRYFDLQCYLKKRMGNRQTIVTNIDYPGATRMKLPPNFTSKYAFFTRYFGLKQLLESGLEFPICLHDHDFFNPQNLPYDENTILVGALVNGYFSEQAIVFPEIAKQAIIDFTNTLWRLDFAGGSQSGYGTKVRHEGMFSTEQTMVNLSLQPFKSIPIRHGFNVKDQVSFDIVSHHSLDVTSICAPDSGKEIPAGSHGVHGHLNKGETTEVLLDWLASSLSQKSDCSA